MNQTILRRMDRARCSTAPSSFLARPAALNIYFTRALFCPPFTSDQARRCDSRKQDYGTFEPLNFSLSGLLLVVERIGHQPNNGAKAGGTVSLTKSVRSSAV